MQVWVYRNAIRSRWLWKRWKTRTKGRRDEGFGCSRELSATSAKSLKLNRLGELNSAHDRERLSGRNRSASALDRQFGVCLTVVAVELHVAAPDRL